MNTPTLDIDCLPHAGQALLYALATAFGGKGKTALLKLLQMRNVKTAGGWPISSEHMPDLLDTLEQLGWGYHEELPRGRFYNLAHEQRNRVLLHLMQSPHAASWLATLKASLPGRGDCQRLETLGEHEYSLFREVITSLLSGTVQRALELTREWLAGVRKQTGKRKLDLPSILNHLYCLALIGAYEPGHRVALKQTLATGVKNNYGRAYPILYSDRYELPTDSALIALVGHPALFWMDRPDVRLDLVAGQPGLHLQVEGECIHLRLAPESLVANSNLVIEKETPTRVLVYPVSPELRQIAAIVGTGLSMPLSAKAQLIEAMGAIAPLLPIHSEIPEQAAHLETVPADARLYAHLLPLETGLRLQLLVRPLAEGGWFRPGQGSRNPLGERNGKTIQILALLLERAAQGPQLVVAPTSATLNWRAECTRFAPTLRARLYHETRSLEDLGPMDLVIVSYGLLQQDSDAFTARRWTSAVLDEAQAIKNAQTKRSQAAMALQADFRMVAPPAPRWKTIWANSGTCSASSTRAFSVARKVSRRASPPPSNKVMQPHAGPSGP
ncbi:SNF2-related protein [Pseudomonas sp. OTU5201]|uniref:SNF2-related protein n=1 Tax=Pseudomonas sp. OTU5201 TaxID=3043850 RepID=UPI00313ADB2A